MRRARVIVTFLSYTRILCAFSLQVAEFDCITSVWGVQLANHVMSTLKISDIDSCYRTCAAKPGCQSINYFREKSLCELNSRAIENIPHMTVVNEDSVYFKNPEPRPQEPVDGNFTEWSNWTSCSFLCGHGTRYRHRSCTNPPPSHGGKSCNGSYNETKNCNSHPCPFPRNCVETYHRGLTQSGAYTIDPDGKGEFKVYCDQKTVGGKWTVFQRRMNGSVDFYLGWHDYKNGFGDIEGELWLGLDKINKLTNQTRSRLRVELEDWDGKSAYAEYDFFAVASERDKYTLSLGYYSGTANDSLSRHRGMAFTTYDSDNDQYSDNCAVIFNGAWWYDGCLLSNLNGQYYNGKHNAFGEGVIWSSWKGFYYSIKRAEMKIRPV